MTMTNAEQSFLLSVVSQILDKGKAMGLANAEVARRADISPEALSRLKSTGRADFATVFRLAEVVDLDILVRPKEADAARLEHGFF